MPTYTIQSVRSAFVYTTDMSTSEIQILQKMAVDTLRMKDSDFEESYRLSLRLRPRDMKAISRKVSFKNSSDLEKTIGSLLNVKTQSKVVSDGPKRLFIINGMTGPSKKEYYRWGLGFYFDSKPGPLWSRLLRVIGL